MARANVSIEGVTQFKKSIEAQNQKVQETGNNVISKLSELQEQLNTEKVKAEKAADELANALVKVQGKITGQEAVVEELEGRLSNLISSEPSPAEELVTEPDEYDDEGNIVSVGASYYEETSAHSSWRSEVSSLESEVSAENSKLQSYKDVESKVLNCQNDIHGQIDLIQGLQTKIESGQVEITQILSELDELAQSTQIKLEKLTFIIQEYIDRTVAFGGSVPENSPQSFLSKIIYPNTTVSGMSVAKFPVSRVPTMSTTFDNSPEWIQNTVSRYGNGVKVCDDTGTSHYRPSQRRIYMNKNYDDDEYADVFKHEFGHYVDHENGWLSETPAFVAAFRTDCERYDLSTWNGAENANKMMRDLMNTENAKYDRCISDILSATYYNDPMIQMSYYSEGIPYYSHENSYWDTRKNRENEVFANLFAIYSNNDEDSIRFVQEKFPNVDRVFQNYLRRE